MQTNRTDMFN